MAQKAESSSQMPMRTLGHTGVSVSLIGLGGWHLGFKSIDDELSIRIIRTAIDNGINFMDNCWDYNEGANGMIMECLQYAMNLPTSVVITGCESMDDLEQALNAAHTFEPMTEEQVKSLLRRTEKAASRGEFEL